MHGILNDIVQKLNHLIARGRQICGSHPPVEKGTVATGKLTVNLSQQRRRCVDWT